MHHQPYTPVTESFAVQLIHIPHSRGIRLVPANQIIRVEGYSNYSKIYFSTGYPMMVAKVLLWFEGQLPQDMFARVHRSHLVNKQFVQEISGSQYCSLLLINGETIAVSRRKKTSLVAMATHKQLF